MLVRTEEAAQIRGEIFSGFFDSSGDPARPL